MAVLLAIVAGAAALVSGAAALFGRGRSDAVVIGGKAMTESTVLGEILARWLERDGIPVERRFNLAGTNVAFEALRSGAIDLYPEYTGTGLLAILRRPAAPDPAAALRVVRAEFARRFDVVWTEPLGFNNTYALAVPRRLAVARGLRRISDLGRHPELTAGFASEFLVRQDGWPGLRARYGLRPHAEPRSMEAGLMYRAAAAGHVDVISAYSTDGRIDASDLVVLEDDRGFFPPYQAVPIVRRDALARHPRLRRRLAALAGAIDDATMRRLNAEVDARHRAPGEVAAEFLRALGRR